MSVDQNQTVDAEAQADVAATPVDATAQAETPAPAAETPVAVEAPVAPKKRTTAAKAAKAAETPAPAAETPVVKTPAPAAETPAAETPVLAAGEVLNHAPLAPAPDAAAPAAAQPQTDPVKPLSNGLVWGSKRKEKQAQQSADQSCEVEITNTGAHSFEAYTRTPLPTNQTVVITCESPRQRAAIVSKLSKLNQLAGVTRYITLIK